MTELPYSPFAALAPNIMFACVVKATFHQDLPKQMSPSAWLQIVEVDVRKMDRADKCNTSVCDKIFLGFSY